MKTALFALLLLITLVGCYPMPTENDYSMIPMTNSPDFTRHKGGAGAAPKINY